MLGCDEEIHGLRVFDSHEKVRVAASVDADEHPTIGIADVDQKPRLRMTMSRESQPGLSLLDASGRTVLTVGGTAGGHGLVLSDSNDKVRAVVGVLDDEPAIMLVDESNETVFRAP